MKKIIRILLIGFVLLMASFTLASATVKEADDIKITSETGGEYVVRGDTATITWTSGSTSAVEYTVEIKYYDENKRLRESQPIDDGITAKTVEVEKILETLTYDYIRIYITVEDTAGKLSDEVSFSDYIKLYEEEEVKVAKEEKDDNAVGSKDGADIGAIDGAAQGESDFDTNKTNDYKRSMSTANQLMEKYNLTKEVAKYREGFLTGYEDAYETAYKKAYREGFSSDLKNETNTSSEYTSVTMDGTTVSSADGNVNLKFEQGSVYLEQQVKVEKTATILTSNQLVGGRYIQGSNVYSVGLKTETGVVNVYKPMTLTLKYIGPENVGVYKITDAGYVYYESEVENGAIKCKIDEREYKGGYYVVLIDKRDRGLTDMEEHWAKAELTLMAKRGWVNGYEDGTFKPAGFVTRAEFSVMLYNALGWGKYNLTGKEPLYFNDEYALSEWGRKAVYCAVVNGVINGYSDGYFRPNQYITYQEIEWMMQRAFKAKGYGNFMWEDMAQVMMDEKGVISKGLTNKKLYITRDETAYALFIMNRGY